jgi:hypothetical protein
MPAKDHQHQDEIDEEDADGQISRQRRLLRVVSWEQWHQESHRCRKQNDEREPGERCLGRSRQRQIGVHGIRKIEIELISPRGCAE